jgi:hypothetical protein
MARITKIAAVETTTAIWEYDPMLSDNRVLNGSLDVIAAIRTLAIKVCSNLELYSLIPTSSGRNCACETDPSIGPANRTL